MENVRGVHPNYEEEDEHIVRRLGWAVVAQWSNLPEEARELLKKQAVFVEDRKVTVQLKQ